MLLNEHCISSSEQVTEEWAAELAGRVLPGTVVAVHGDLGTGKTVFARGFARGLGIVEPVSSPTYTIIQEYKLNDGWFFHLDLYRIDDVVAGLAFGVDEYFDRSDAFVVVEWPERISEILPPDTLHIAIIHAGENTREIRLMNRKSSLLGQGPRLRHPRRNNGAV